MKRSFSINISIISVLLLLSCGGSGIIRTIQEDNVFFSSYQPKIRIKINPAFKLFQDEQLSDIGFGSDGSLSSSYVTTENYYFVKSGADKIRVIHIVFQKLRARP